MLFPLRFTSFVCFASEPDLRAKTYAVDSLRASVYVRPVCPEVAPTYMVNVESNCAFASSVVSEKASSQETAQVLVEGTALAAT